MRPLILISNDDGLYSKGLEALVGLAREQGDVLVVVPDREQSGASTAFTIESPLRLNKIKEKPGLTIYTLSGTPVDCVKIALNMITKDRKPDLVMSGINHGFNGTIAIHYSGTLGAVLEGCFEGCKAIGFSYDSHRKDIDFTPCLPYLRSIINKVLEKGLPPYVCLSVNIPDISKLSEGGIKGIKPCRQAKGKWTEGFTSAAHPTHDNLYWMSGDRVSLEEPEATDHDLYWLEKGYITTVPEQVDMTCYPLLQEMQDWGL